MGIDITTHCGKKEGKNQNDLEALTCVKDKTSQIMMIQFKAAPKQIELQNRAWSHPKAIEKIFQMRLSSYL